MASEVTGGVRKRVLIVGGGFAGLKAAEALSKAEVNVTLVDRRNHHTFQPLLYQVALAVLPENEIAQPIRSIVNYPNTQVLMDEVVGFDTTKQRAMLKGGATLEYDYLIVASGSTHSYFGHDEWAPLAPGLKTIEDAIDIRRRVLLAFELAEGEMQETGRHPALNFVIIGGGATGVELAGAISDVSKLYIRRDYKQIDPATAQVLILEGSPTILGAYPPDLQKSALEQLNKLGITVRTNTRVTDVQPGYVMVGEERIDAVVTLWGAGVEASPLGKLLGVAVDRKGSVIVDERLHPAGHPEIFVCGDLAALKDAEGKPVPGVAQPAMQMGDYAGKSIAAEVKGSRLNKPFHYFDKGDMATIGRSAAIANVKWPFKAHLSGFPAWAAWLSVHIFFLIGFRNRFSVLRNWAYTYAFAKEGSRLITGDQTLPGWNVTDDPAGKLTTRPILGHAESI
ncbi:MAG: NAD(P)/FAD-dependent oxidoreductase [Janthinobacterium lividum]